MTNRRTEGGASEAPDLWEEYGIHPDRITRPVFVDRRGVVQRDRQMGQQFSPPERSDMMTSISSLCRQCSFLQRSTPMLITAVNLCRHSVKAPPGWHKDQGYPRLRVVSPKRVIMRYQRAALMDAGRAAPSKDFPKRLKGVWTKLSRALSPSQGDTKK